MTRYWTCLFWMTCLLMGQHPRLSNLRGELQGSVSPDTQVKLTPCGASGAAATAAYVDSRGGFEFRGVEPGCYQVNVVSQMTGATLYHGVHDVGRGSDGLQIQLKQTPGARPVTGGVALGALRPKPPKRAVKLLDAAAGLSARGDYAAAAEKLRDAIRVHPAFAEAHINLGAQLSRLGQLREALGEFDQARLLGVNDVGLWTNIAAAQIGLKDAAAADAALQQANSLDPSYPQARFLTGHLCLLRNRPTEAVTHLEMAQSLPGARILLAQVLARLGRSAEAATAARAYLASGHANYRPFAEKLLRDLSR